MMGRSHAASGWCAGAALAPYLGLHTLPQVVTFATITGGFAILNDLDHLSATATKSLGPITHAVSIGLRAASHVAYEATKGPKDEKSAGKHRHLSHTAIFAGVVGLGTAVGTRAGGMWATFGVLLFGVLLFQAALGPSIRKALKALHVLKRRKGKTDHLILPIGAGAAMLVTHDPAWHAALHAATGWVGVAVALGCLVHCAGDALTEAGCPILWPIPIAGETWYELGLPEVMRFKTNGVVERWIVFPAFIGGGILILPGAWDEAVNTIHAALDTQRQTRAG